jgi:integration host factor subunit beta
MASDQEQSTEQPTLTKSELVAYISQEQPQLSEQDVELAVNSILECMSRALVDGERIEIRGFGSMSLHYRPPRIGRNPKTGEKVQVPEKYVPHFKPGANLRKRVDEGFKEK